MRTLLCTYLLLKSLLGKKFTFFDVALANAMVENMWWPGMDAPAYLKMIAHLKGENVLPEAWADFKFELMHRSEAE